MKAYNRWLATFARHNFETMPGLKAVEDWRAVVQIKARLGSGVRVVAASDCTRPDELEQLHLHARSLANEAVRSGRVIDETGCAFVASEAIGRRDAVVGTSAKRTVPGQEASDDAAMTAPRASGIKAQAAALLAKAADSPKLSGLIAAGLDMALRERRVATLIGKDTLDTAQTLQAVLEKRGRER